MNRAKKSPLVERMNEDVPNDAPRRFWPAFSGLTRQPGQRAAPQGRRASAAATRWSRTGWPSGPPRAPPVEPLAGQLSGPVRAGAARERPGGAGQDADRVRQGEPAARAARRRWSTPRTLVDAAGVKQLATLPGLPELRAQLLALIQTPATSWCGCSARRRARSRAWSTRAARRWARQESDGRRRPREPGAMTSGSDRRSGREADT